MTKRTVDGAHEDRSERLEDQDDRSVLEPRYRPVLALDSGQVVGAELLRAAASPTSSTGSVPMLARAAVHAFSSGPAATEGWWVAVALRPGQVAAPPAADAVAALLLESGLPGERLVLQVTQLELAHAVSSGAAAALGALGVRFSVIGFGVEAWSASSLRSAPVASVQISLAGLDRADPHDVSVVRSVVAVAEACGVDVLGRDVESDEQIGLASDAGVALVEGYWWGSPGSLSKLVATWTRLPVSE